jgi:hypothetical protein
MGTTDRRRFGVIETRYRIHGRLAMYDLLINGKLWACVEWSARRKGWCIQDASGRCHCDAIHGQDVDAQTAIKLAKAMIRDGRIPNPEEAQQQLEERLRRTIQPFMPSINYVSGNHGDGLFLSCPSGLVAKAALPLAASIGDGGCLLAAPHRFSRAWPSEAKPRDGAPLVSETRPSAPAIQ